MHDLLERLAPEVDVDAAWDEVAARLGTPGRGRAPRILAVAAAMALVAGGVALANRAGKGSEDGVTAIDGGLVRFEDDGADVTVDYPADWHRGDEVALNGRSVPESVLLATMPIPAGVHDEGAACPGQPIQALEILGPDDALVWIIRESPDSFDGLPATNQFALPAGVARGDEYAPCLDGAADFAFSAFGLEPGRGGLQAAVYLGPEATSATRDAVSAVLTSLAVVDEDTAPFTTLVSGQGPAPTVVIAPSDSLDPESARIIAEVASTYEMPPGVTFTPRFVGPITIGVAELQQALSLQAACPWYRYVLDAEGEERVAAVAGVRRLIQRLATESPGLQIELYGLAEAATSGDLTGIEQYLEANC